MMPMFCSVVAGLLTACGPLFAHAAVEMFPSPNGLPPSPHYQLEVETVDGWKPSHVYFNPARKDGSGAGDQPGRSMSWTTFHTDAAVRVRVTATAGSADGVKIRPSRLGIVVASTHRSQHRTSPDQGVWVNAFLGDAYRAEVGNLNRHIGGYPADLKFVQSCIKESAERYEAKRTYASLEKYSTVQALIDAAKALPEGEIINVLCWGSLTEPAILVNHCLATGQPGVLKKVRFIAHWTNSSFRQGSKEHPEDVANCREDAAACAYLKEMAFAGMITYYECGAIGQHGIVSGSQKGMDYFNQFRVSRVGTIFVDGKFAHNSVDHSDSATYWVLLGNWGVSLENIAANGTNDPEVERRNEQTFLEWSPRIHDELLRRARAAAGRPPQVDNDHVDQKR